MESMLRDMEDVIRQLQDTATVMAGIQARQAEALQEHAIWLQEHDRAIAEQRERDKIIDQRFQELGERIDNLVSGIGEYIRRRDADDASRQ
jgi:hypothetical protein